MKQSLPAQPSLEHLKTQAKDLLAAAKRGEPEAVARFPKLPPTLALHDAQSVIAHEYGFPSWRALRGQVLGEENLRALYERHLTIPLPREVIVAALGLGSPERETLDVPADLPLLPLRNALLVPGAVAPLDIGRSSTVTAIDSAKSGLLAVFAQRDPAVTDPTETDFHPIGCVARIVKTTPKPEGGLWLVLHGLAWVALDSVAAGRVTIAPFDIESDSAARAEELRAVIAAAAMQLPDPAPIRERVQRMTPLELADAAVANATCSVEAKAEYASERRLSARIDRALALLAG